jgi:hypothetical protein
MNLFEELSTFKDDDKEARLACAKIYAAQIYGLEAATLETPEQGDQVFTFITDNKIIRIARSLGMSAVLREEAVLLRTLQGKTKLSTPPVLDSRPDQHIMSIGLLPGEQLSQDEFALWPTLTERTQNNIAARIGHFIGEMHGELPTSDRIEIPGWRDFVLGKIDECLRYETD